ncbi:MAG TPA: alpha/beta hydrolase [Chloroflexota bacterium]|jgi:acetyl esterase/lipase|nr:alpha/beta hydrolase [Chloroflexota bacterium]
MATHVQYDVDVRDIEYQRHAGQPWLARVYRPVGPGPFPTIVDIHGGAWNNGDRTNDAQMDHALAALGILSVAIDFRQPPLAGYPASVCDMNLAIRWTKVQAAELGGTERVGALGVSSGGHLALLGGLRPRDPRYAALALEGHPEVDASLAYVVACWPVSDPLYRYQLAREAANTSIVKAHEAYWGTEAAMAEGNPPLILERGEPVELPPALVIQRTVDNNHPLDMQQRLVSWYRKRGGQMEMPLFENLPSPFSLSGNFPDSQRAVDTIATFIKQQNT